MASRSQQFHSACLANACRGW